MTVEVTEAVRYEVKGDIAVVTINHPPVNALGVPVRTGIPLAVGLGIDDDEVKAIVIIGEGRGFIAGADIRAMDSGQQADSQTQATEPAQPAQPVPSAQNVVEASPKPVIAAIHGFALGGGYEIALSCNYRVALTSARVGLPEILIGILPGGGGTQRLPRLIGPSKALDCILSGRHVPAPEAFEMGMVDALIDADDDLLEGAIEFAHRVADVRPLPIISERTDMAAEADQNPGLFDDIRARLERTAKNQIAPQNCLRAVEEGIRLPFPDAMRRERELFSELVGSDQAFALRYAFFVEREAARIPDIPADTPIRTIDTVAVIGGGTMGSGIAMALADAGVPVRLMEKDAGALENAMARIRETYQVSVTRGSLPESEMKQRVALIQSVAEYSEIADADLVIEAVFEDMDVKKEIFAALDANMKPGAILATNTSALDIDEIATAVSRPGDVIGTHFFSPANVMQLLEVVRGAETAPDAVATLMTFGKRMGKVPVACGNSDGFVANRSRGPMTNEANILLEEGALPQDIDRVMTDFGFRMGPFAVADLAGGDIGYAIRKRREADDPGARQLPIADRLVEMNRLGQKTGAGWYRYEEGSRTPLPDPEVEALIREIAGQSNARPREFSDEEILRRLLLASVNEGCRILGEGVAYRASDIDIMWLYGFGFPRYQGGPMYWADQIGVTDVLAQIEEWESELGSRWAPAPYLKELVRSGKTLRQG